MRCMRPVDVAHVRRPAVPDFDQLYPGPAIEQARARVDVGAAVQHRAIGRTLLQDLAELGLLDTTIVWWSGEFGRTPKVQWEAPWNGGRNHWGQVFCALLAGGGFKGGRLVGASDAKGEQVKERPVYPVDLIASMYDLLGIEPLAKLPHPQGLEVRVLPTAAEGVKTAGRLAEIM